MEVVPPMEIQEIQAEVYSKIESENEKESIEIQEQKFEKQKTYKFDGKSGESSDRKSESKRSYKSSNSSKS